MRHQTLGMARLRSHGHRVANGAKAAFTALSASAVPLSQVMLLAFHWTINTFDFVWPEKP